MPYINTEKETIIGWYDTDANRFLCDECFSKEKDIEDKDYEPIVEDEMDSKDLYICDECRERFCGS